MTSALNPRGESQDLAAADRKGPGGDGWSLSVDPQGQPPPPIEFQPQEEGLMSVEDRVKAIIAEQLLMDEEEVTPGANLCDDLGADSLDCVELVMQIEEAFDLEIPDEDVENVKTVKDVLDYVATKVK